VEEALRWLPTAPVLERLSSVDALSTLGVLNASSDARARVLVADDNADMRDYVSRLLGVRYHVIAAVDGQDALQKAHVCKPDLVLTDVMMPNLDGFGLLKALRSDARTQTIPLIMLSARAGEEARVEGLDAGADDYIIKPFSARELVARVAGALALARARREALRREQELRAETTDVLESIAEGFIALDAGFRVTYLNPEAERMIGQPRALSLGQLLSEAFPAAGEPEFQRELARVLAQAKPGKLEHYYEPWRKWFEVDAYPKHPGVALYFRDITERKLKTEQLHALAQAAVVVNSNLSIAETLRVVTERARGIVGAHQAIAVFTRDQRWLRGVQARSLSEKYAAWNRDGTAETAAPLYRLVCEHNRALRFTQAELEALPAFVTSDLAAAQLPPLRGWLAVPLVGGDGKNLGLLQLSDKYDGEFSEQDEAILMQLAQLASVAITNAQLYQSTQEARADAETANRMKDQFLATLSHELRTPLNAILGWARILQTGRIDEAVLKQGLDTIERNSRLQAQLIEDLLDLSRIISGKLRLEVQRVSLIDVIESALATTRPAADAKEIRCHSVLDPLAGPVNGDPARLQQIVWNLVSNAVKFTPRGGRIQVVLERVNSMVEISVIDTGLGIRPDFLPYVFDRFRQADSSTTRRHGGLGLGLSIVRQLTEMHGGTVRVKSPGEGMGSTFTVCLPILVAHDQDAPAQEHALPALATLEAPLAPLDGVKVLVVDDELDARELIRRILSDCRAEVSAAGSVQEALATVDRFGPHILLSDIGMPEQDGFELIRRLRMAGWGARTLPAVALTAFARSEDRRRALLAGFQVHIAKPVDPGELVATIASLLGRTGAS
jgi:PAS domain S-box-containing protein